MSFSRNKTPLLSLGVLIILVLIVVSFMFFATHTTYLTEIQESVSGLKSGSRVEFNGVVIGKVSHIQINRDNPKLIDVFLSISKNAPVSENTVAMLAYNEDEPGKPFISLTDDHAAQNVLTAAPGQTYPTIPSIPSTKANMNASLTEIARNMKQFNATFQALMTKDDIESFRQLIYSMQTVMGMLAENNKRLNHIIMNTETASDQFSSFLSNSRVTIQTLQNETLPSTYRLIGDMEDMLGKMDALMTDVKQNPAVLIRGKAQLPPGPSE